MVGSGDIIRGDASDDGSGESNLTSYGFNKLLRRVGNDSQVKGVVVRIDSPGGEVTASDEIWHEMNLLAKKKPMVISMSDAAASGGYYMAMTGRPDCGLSRQRSRVPSAWYSANQISTGCTTSWGSRRTRSSAARTPSIDSDYTALTPEQRALLQDGIDESYKDFVTKVADVAAPDIRADRGGGAGARLAGFAGQAARPGG